MVTHECTYMRADYEEKIHIYCLRHLSTPSIHPMQPHISHIRSYHSLHPLIFLHSLFKSKQPQYILLCSTSHLSHYTISSHILTQTPQTPHLHYVFLFFSTTAIFHVAALINAVGTAAPSYALLFTLIPIALQLNTFIPPNTFPTALILDFTCLYSSIYSIYRLWRFVPSRNVPQGNGHARRTSISPYPNTPALLLQALLYQHLFHSCTPLQYPFILQLAILSFKDPQFHSYTFFTNSSLFFLLRWPSNLKYFLFTHSTAPHLTPHKFHCHIFHTGFHSFHSPILPRHMLLWYNECVQHALLTTVPYSMSKSIYQCWQENTVP